MNLLIAQRLQQLRKEQGYSQEELADKLGVSRQAISKWERAEASPDTDNLIALAELYHVSLDELIRGESAVEPAKNEVTVDEEGITLTDDEGNSLHFGKAPVTDKEPRLADDDEIKDVYIHNGKKICFDKDGNPVVSKKGKSFYLDENGNPVFKKGNKVVSFDKDGNPIISKEEKKRHRVKSAVNCSIVMLTVILFVTLGAIYDIWHPLWLLFVFMPVPLSLTEAILKKKASHFALPVLATSVFLLVGCVWGIWHPTWVVFLAVPIYYSICGIFEKEDNDDDDDEDDEDDDKD